MLMRGYIHHTRFQTEYVECCCSCLRASAFWDAKGCFGPEKFAEPASTTLVEISEMEVEEKMLKYNPVTSVWISGRDKAIWHASAYSRVAEVEALKHLRYWNMRFVCFFCHEVEVTALASEETKRLALNFAANISPWILIRAYCPPP